MLLQSIGRETKTRRSQKARGSNTSEWDCISEGKRNFQEENSNTSEIKEEEHIGLERVKVDRKWKHMENTYMLLIKEWIVTWGRWKEDCENENGIEDR